MTNQIEFKHIFPLEVWCILLQYLNIETYKHILKVHHVENGEYSIIHLLSFTCTSLDNLKSKIKI